MDFRKKEIMEKVDIINYIKQLESLESQLSNNDSTNGDIEFANELNSLLTQLGSDVQSGYQQSYTTKVKIKKLDPNAVIPTYSKDGDAGMDLTITDIKENTSFSITYGFGIAIEIPKGYVGLIFPRSSVRNQDLILSNCVGVIDSGYRGELQATFKKTQGLDSLSYNVGERGAQIIILPYPTIYMTEVPELSDTERGTDGFGSTGK
jgi:dUTP pyrophosphatase